MIRAAFLLLLSLPAWAHDSDCERALLSKLQKVSFQESLRNAPDVRESVIRYFRDLNPDSKAQLDRHLAARHASREMSFQVKNEKTGNYDKFVAVPVNSAIAPMLKSDYDRLVHSTQPLMQLYRTVLQKLYSKPDASAQDLGFADLPKAEADLAMNVIRNSIYFEPALVNPSMANYPFLTVGGFDGAIVDPARPVTEFFETNLGTPSGISNNGQLLDEVLGNEDLLRSWVDNHRPKDDTYLILRNAIESNALTWTGKKGLSVVVSPGIFNGAHPDVATIARESGMPLVKSSDLYEDREGNIRLNAGLSAHDPTVTGIYGRMEESFFLQNNADGIPMISPQFESQTAFEKKFGVKLRPGAIYDWIYDKKGEITGVRRDDQGQPRLQEIWSSIGEDPTRPGVKGSFARAIINKKLYYSALGGRVVDDKRLFRILTRYLLPQQGELARPVQGLAPAEFGAYFAAPHLFVVKEPDKSGGQGIYFPRAMEAKDIEALNARVRATPTAFEIQYVSPIATIKDAKAEVPIDLRIFVMMDGKGQVRAGPNSVLLRTGADGGLYTNTSRGGGYGIAMILEDKPVGLPLPLPAPKPEILPASRFKEIATFEAGTRELMKCLRNLTPKSPNAHWQNCRTQALNLSFEFRQIMDLVSAWDLQAVERLRNFGHGTSADPAGPVALAQAMRNALKTMASKGVIQNAPADELRVWDAVEMHIKKLPVRAELRRLPAPEISYNFTPVNKIRSRKVEYAEYLWVDNPEIQAVIDEVKAFGGQIRFLGREDFEETPEGVREHLGQEPAYFWINLDPQSPSYLIPVIGIDLSRELSLAGLYHEREHFRHTRELYNVHRSRGLNHEEALKEAYAETNTDLGTIEGERRAVAAELKVEVELPHHPFNQLFGQNRDAILPHEPGYANRMLYPEFEGVRRHLHRSKWQNEPVNEEFLRQTLTSAIKSALEIKQKALEHWKKEKPEHAKVFQKSSVYSMLTEPYGAARLTTSLIGIEFRQWLGRVCAELQVSEADCGVPVP